MMGLLGDWSLGGHSCFEGDGSGNRGGNMGMNGLIIVLLVFHKTQGSHSNASDTSLGSLSL